MTQRVAGLARFGLNTHDGERLARFYVHAFDCSIVSRERRSGRNFSRLMGVRGGAECLTLHLGCAEIDVYEFDDPGRPYPPDLSPYDSEFQHFAIVVADMDQAFERLSQTQGWSAISTGGPQRLPEKSGGVTAYKFRDPDGHPLELLSFPTGRGPAPWRSNDPRSLFLGVDHSAISVADTERSIDYYASLGLRVAAKNINQGPEQQRLDGVPHPIVDVIALQPPQATPHVELLGYRGVTTRARPVRKSNDIAASRLVFRADAVTGDSPQELLQDPDGHFIQIADISPRARLKSTDANPF
jgi:catechol 2,3-dioxygenase-like lactoylglutathione lyase family enzyme